MNTRVTEKNKNISSQKLVYIVDDEPLLGEIAEVILNSEGYLTRRFVIPHEVIELIKSGGARPDLLLTDYIMNGMTGIELIRRVRALDRTIRTILVSGTVEEGSLADQETKPDYFIA